MSIITTCDYCPNTTKEVVDVYSTKAKEARWGMLNIRLSGIHHTNITRHICPACIKGLHISDEPDNDSTLDSLVRDIIEQEVSESLS